MANNTIAPKEHSMHDALVKKEQDFTDQIAHFAGDIRFVYVHAVFFIVWIAVNVLMDDPFDPYPFIFLTFVVSLEAIFLATFVLINQNKDSVKTERRARLDLEVDKRSEKEIEEIKISIEELKKSLKNRYDI